MGTPTRGDLRADGARLRFRPTGAARDRGWASTPCPAGRATATARSAVRSAITLHACSCAPRAGRRMRARAPLPQPGRRSHDHATSATQYIIGVDLGGTNIVAGAMTMDGTRHLACAASRPTPRLGDEGVAERIVRLVEERHPRHDARDRRARARTSSASASARPARSTASAASCWSRRISAGRTFRCATASSDRLGLPDDARQRRELRDVRRVVAGRGARRPQRGGADDRHRHRRRPDPRRRAVSRRVATWRARSGTRPST